MAVPRLLRSGALPGSEPIGPISMGLDAAMNQNSILPGILCTLGMMAFAGAALFFSWRASLKKYLGSSTGGGKTKSAQATDWINARQFYRLPGTSAQASGVATGTIYNLLRAPEVLAALLPLVAALVFGTPYLLGWEGYELSPWLAEWMPMMLVFLTLIGFPAFLFSTFSYDRDGFRAFVLCPAPRHEILHGRNVGIGVLTFICGLVTLVYVQCFLPTGPGWFLGTLLQIPASYLLLALAGNAISIFLPIGFKRGSMSPVNVKVLPAVAIYVGVILGPAIAMTPASIIWSIGKISLLANWPGGWVYFGLTVTQLVLTWFAYRLCMIPLGRALWRRETLVMDVVANIPE